MPVMFLSHARTPEELRDEVCADLRRRAYDYELRARLARSAREKATYGCAIGALEEMLNTWLVLKIERPMRERKSRAQVG